MLRKLISLPSAYILYSFMKLIVYLISNILFMVINLNLTLSLFYSSILMCWRHLSFLGDNSNFLVIHVFAHILKLLIE